MPKQRAVLGLRIGPGRISMLLVSLGLFALFTLIFTLPSAIPTGPSLSKTIADSKATIPKYKDKISSSILNPFRSAAHKPPEQKNSEYGGSSWYSDWNWRNPFSSSVTLDENRSLLPPLKERAPIYAYYDTTIERDAATKEAESALLLTWRRAWWAQGFKPVILSVAEATNNPLYHELQGMEVEPTFKKDMMRWLAWENMGGGLLSHHLLLPMAARQDPLLSFLRRAEYPALTRWEGLDDSLFAGTLTEITTAISQALRNPQKKSAKDLISAVSSDTFQVDPSRESLAFYGAKNVAKSYPKVSDEQTADHARGLKSLNLLINSHLHNTWQHLFSDGIAVLKPMPTHTNVMIEPALELATRLASCSDSPVPASCPPNLPKCVPCVSSHPLKVSTPARYRNKTAVYTIGTVPHPYTLRTLEELRETIDVAFIRRDTKRDNWLYVVFQELLGTGISGSARVLRFKEAVAGEFATSHSLWLTGEKETLPHDLDWWFGFALPPNGTDDGKSETPVPGPERRPKPKHDPADGPIPDDYQLTREPGLLKRAREVEKSKEAKDVRIREAIEAWNLADTEAWRFAKAFLARSRVQREQWEEEESKFADGAGRDTTDGGRRSSWARWSDGGDEDDD
ncbi:Uu.00g074170.m01.CDS01 [Anthostomella pinea]|uniref:Uu.00g074170.m01.CDS01 n=1 Tax=Anthostomella pinea TaxID=933095 RepID=A0AAI8YLL8_9PEZI|nr:Uu.00g074170.m01.CDS01 [Anthostomella pinea]